MKTLFGSEKSLHKAKNYLHQKVIWITGASSGIGEQLALLLNQLDAKLIISARSETRLKKVKEAMTGDKTNVHVFPLDLECIDALPEKIIEAVSIYGHIDMLINNAGIAMRDYALNTSLEVDRKIMNVNYFATIALTKALLPGMLKRKSGHIVVISSMQGKYGVPRSAAYAASKHALHGFFSSLRTEIDTHIVPVTIILPGIICTEITKHAMRGDGSCYNKQERTQAEGLPASVAAAGIIKAIANKKEEAFVGGSEGFTLFINRVSPRLMNRIVAHHPLQALRRIKESLHFGNRQTVKTITTP